MYEVFANDNRENEHLEKHEDAAIDIKQISVEI